MPGQMKPSVGDLHELSAKSKQEIFGKLSKYGGKLRNSPAFFGDRRKELFSMCEQIGDPSAFLTNAHADTHCPYLARYLVARARLAEPDPKDYPNFKSTVLDPFKMGLSTEESAKIKRENMIRFPADTAEFFHLKTLLYIEHICVGVLGADSYWVRYEWQSCGSTHAQY